MIFNVGMRADVHEATMQGVVDIPPRPGKGQRNRLRQLRVKDTFLREYHHTCIAEAIGLHGRFPDSRPSIQEGS